MSNHSGKLFTLLAAMLALAGFAAYQHITDSKPDRTLMGEIPVEISARALPLNERDPSVHRAGAMRYLAGWALTADHANFGGFSGLVVSKDGRLTAISDRGDWLEADLDLRAENPLTSARMRPFSADATGQEKVAFDSESVIAAGDGFLVAFEGEHRLVEVAADHTTALSPLTAHMDFTGVSGNSGMEAITFAGGYLFALPERGLDVQGRLRGWLVNSEGSEPVYFRPPANYSPTDAATMTNGDVLLLLRRYSPFDGVSAKIVRLRGAGIVPGATLEGEELLHLEPPYSVDNMEGLDVIERPGEPPVVLLISDDNFRASQRTLLLVFSLETS
jgi:hypothetical protein